MIECDGVVEIGDCCPEFSMHPASVIKVLADRYSPMSEKYTLAAEYKR